MVRVMSDVLQGSVSCVQRSRGARAQTSPKVQDDRELAHTFGHVELMLMAGNPAAG